MKELKNERPEIQEKQVSMQHFEKLLQPHGPATNCRERETFSYALPTADRQDQTFNPATWGPLADRILNREYPATSPQEVNQPTTSTGSHHPSQVNSDVLDPPDHQRGYMPSIEEKPGFGNSTRNNQRESHTEDIARALHRVVNMPKIEYLHFNGDLLKYGIFIHNFENCLERDDPDKPRKLQLLIQLCNGKAKEAIECCVNLPSKDGYRVA